MTTDELKAMHARVTQQIDVVRTNLLRLEGYRHCLADQIQAEEAAAEKAAAPGEPTTDQPTTENTDAQAAA